MLFLWAILHAYFRWFPPNAKKMCSGGDPHGGPPILGVVTQRGLNIKWKTRILLMIQQNSSIVSIYEEEIRWWNKKLGGTQNPETYTGCSIWVSPPINSFLNPIFLNSTWNSISTIILYRPVCKIGIPATESRFFGTLFWLKQKVFSIFTEGTLFWLKPLWCEGEEGERR